MDEYELGDKKDELKALQQRQDAIRLENSMLSDHLTRVITRKGSLQVHLENAEDEDDEDDPSTMPASPVAVPAGRRSMLRSFSIFQDAPAGAKASVRFQEGEHKAVVRSNKIPRAPISIEEKCEIVDEEIRCHNEHYERVRADNERVLDDLKAILSEANHQMKEIVNEKNSFHRDLLILAEVNPRGKLYAEDFLRFEKEKHRKKRNIRDKLQEKIDLLHMEIMEAEHQFSNKRDLKDILHTVDFDQLNIQNLQLNSRMRDRTAELWNLKRSSSKSARLLAKALKELSEGMAKGVYLRECIAERTPQISASQFFIALEKKDHRKLKEDVMRMTQEKDGPPQATVLEYMRMRQNVAALRKELKTWLSKVDVAELSHMQLKKHVRSVLTQRASMFSSARTTPPIPPPVLLVQG